jgi:nucleoid-associated protein YgaU
VPSGPAAGFDPEQAAAQAAVLQPPAPLPARGPDALPPALDATYRSTVEIPPPPLLDVHAPPPLAVGWGAHGVVRPAVSPDPLAPAVAGTGTYVVRDGDDLTGIAMRVYGHAGAAAAIWNANRDRLADPRLLPIGITLRMPPSWMLPAARAAAGAGSIEPRGAGGKGAEFPHGGAGTRIPPRPEGHWLGEAASPSSAAARPERDAALPGVERVPTGSRPGTVRVAPGDTLDGIALRLYGDRGMASRIWSLNRERLRSPELLVPGTDLRLP